MGFYEELSRYYDIIFPLGENNLEFIRKRVKPNSRILDIACGTGNYTLALAELGFEVDGIDLDEKMIESAKNKAEKDQLKSNFKVGDMKEIDGIFKEGRYDLVFCIGNSLVHLHSEDEIKNIISKTYNLLSTSGSIVIQIVNYDRILKYNVDHLPTIRREDRGVEFVRKYDYNESIKKVNFNTEIIVNRNGNKLNFTNSISLFPLQSKDLRRILEEVGYKNISFYGSFKEEEYNENSFATIVHAQK